jgi:hypothetical protein
MVCSFKFLSGKNRFDDDDDDNKDGALLPSSAHISCSYIYRDFIFHSIALYLARYACGRVSFWIAEMEYIR